MTKIITDNSIVDSAFEVVADDVTDVSRPNQILPLQVYLANYEMLADRDDVGVWLDADDEVETLEGKTSCAVIALNFPAFNDGRAYSSANMLRRQFGFSGDLLAIGDVRRDQLEQMLRCGFTSFQMADGQDIDAALAGLRGFSENYQTTADKPTPLFRRR
jgi:uncharacterized protein (DUF934 family)